MKTKELIDLLQKSDPDNECDVCIDNMPISWIERLEYYYDGRLQRIEKEKGYPVRGGYPIGVEKIKIHFYSLEDALLDNPRLELDLSGITYNGVVNQRYLDAINNWKQDGILYQQWSLRVDAAKRNGKPIPEFPTPPLTFRNKFTKFLRKLKIID